jgi:acetylornithine deacetylase/succinyl-diaminopimelate desuccinylase-like protein
MPSSSAAAVDRATLIAWAQKFARYPSQQTALFEQEPEVQGFIADCVMPLVRELGLPARRDRMGNLLVEIGPQNADKSLMLMAYAMTHPAAAMKNPFAGELIDTPAGQAVRGRGISEQKGSLASALAATVAAHRAGTLKGRLVFTVSTAGETGRHDAAQAMIDALGFVPKLGVIVIGTTSRISLGNKGRLDVLVTVSGKAAHSSTPWAGVNAIEGLRQVLDQLATFTPPGGPHDGLGSPTLTPTFIETKPRATHTVQGEAVLTLDRRLLPGQSPELALAEIRNAVALPEPWRLAVEPGPFMYPAEIKLDGALVRAASAGATAAGLTAPPHFWSHGALDAGYLCHIGCEAAMWGPGPMDSWHSNEESILASDLVDGAAAYEALIRNCLM